MGDEEIKNPREWDFHLDVNETLDDGRTWKSGSKVFHQKEVDKKIIARIKLK